MQGIASAGGYTYPEGHMPSGSWLDIGRLGANRIKNHQGISRRSPIWRMEGPSFFPTRTPMAGNLSSCRQRVTDPGGSSYRPRLQETMK